MNSRTSAYHGLVIDLNKRMAHHVQFHGEILPFLPEKKTQKMIVISLWMEKRHAEAYAREFFPMVEQMLKPFLMTPISWKVYAVETTVCENFAKAVAA